jgi:hypothetical protein
MPDHVVGSLAIGTGDCLGNFNGRGVTPVWQEIRRRRIRDGLALLTFFVVSAACLEPVELVGQAQ